MFVLTLGTYRATAPSNEALLRLIDAGIHALEQGEDTPFELDADQLMERKESER